MNILTVMLISWIGAHLVQAVTAVYFFSTYTLHGSRKEWLMTATATVLSLSSVSILLIVLVGAIGGPEWQGFYVRFVHGPTWVGVAQILVSVVLLLMMMVSVDADVPASSLICRACALWASVMACALV